MHEVTFGAVRLGNEGFGALAESICTRRLVQIPAVVHQRRVDPHIEVVGLAQPEVVVRVVFKWHLLRLADVG